MFKTLKDVDLKNKRVLVRVDFNVPLDSAGRVDPSEDWRIKNTLPTIEYLQKQSAKIILIAHFGRPKGQRDLKFSVKPLSDYLSKILQVPMVFVDDFTNETGQRLTADLAVGQIAFLENIRFYAGEEINDPEFAKQLARLGDVYVNDAFSNSHREHASVVGLPALLPSVAGLLLAREGEILSKVFRKPKRPLVVLIGGVKISSKLKFIKRFLQTADHVILGGALANTVLAAMGLAIGRSVVEEKIVDELRALNLTDPKLHLPVDAIVAPEPTAEAPHRVVAIGSTRSEEMILDIGPDSQRLFGDIIMNAGTVIWTGPVGLFEIDAFSQGMKKIGQFMTKTTAHTIVGGGDTVGFLSKQGLLDQIDYVSTGGSAMLDFLANGQLPGLKVLGY